MLQGVFPRISFPAITFSDSIDCTSIKPCFNVFKCTTCVLKLADQTTYSIHKFVGDLELVEDGIGAAWRRLFPGGEDAAADGGLHEQLLKHRVHVACCSAVLQAHKRTRPPVTRRFDRG